MGRNRHFEHQAAILSGFPTSYELDFTSIESAVVENRLREGGKAKMYMIWEWE